MTDPELQAAMQVLSVLFAPAYLTDSHLWGLQACRMVSVSMQHGTSGASAVAYTNFGIILGRAFHRYDEGYRLGRLACDLVEKYSQAKVWLANCYFACRRACNIAFCPRVSAD